MLGDTFQVFFPEIGIITYHIKTDGVNRRSCDANPEIVVAEFIVVVITDADGRRCECAVIVIMHQRPVIIPERFRFEEEIKREACYCAREGDMVVKEQLVVLALDKTTGFSGQVDILARCVPFYIGESFIEDHAAPDILIGIHFNPGINGLHHIVVNGFADGCDLVIQVPEGVGDGHGCGPRANV